MGKDLKNKELGKGLSQRSDGRYQARFTNKFGKRETLYSRDLKELKEQLAINVAKDKLNMNIIDKTVTVNDWFFKWMDVYKYGIISPNTDRHYRTVYMKHISPLLSNIKLHEVTQLQVKALINNLDKAGYKYETQNKVRILLLDMFNKAMDDNFVTKNPARGVKVVRNEAVEPKYLTPEEQKLFMDYCKGTFYDNMFIVALNTGMRPGEIYALTENDLDFKEKTISVTKNLVYQKYEGDEQKNFHLGPPKTKASYRKIKMTRACEVALKKQIMQSRLIKSRTPKVLKEELKDLLFTTKYGTPINAEIECDSIMNIIDGINLMRDDMEQLEYFGGHCFRHTFASNCYRSGFSWKSIQKLLGHTNLSFTTDRYVHLFAEEVEEDIEVLSEAMDKLETWDMYDKVDNDYEEICQMDKESSKRIISLTG